MLLAIGGLYLQHDSLSRNQEKAETEIGPKAHEAKLAMQGSLLGILGGQIELVGLAMRSSATYVKAPWSQEAAAVGGALVKFGALFSAIAGVFDTAQAITAAKRASAAGDSLALSQYRWSVALFGFGTLAFAGAVFNPLFIGPLGIAVMLTLSAYALSKRAEENESTALERWARRCCFGKGDEKPIVHWNAPEYADIAFAELNAATLGVQASLHFESILLNEPGTPKIGGLVSLERDQKLKFQVVLPHYRHDVSAYRWSLIAHRGRDGEFPEYIGGETLISEDYHARHIKPLSKHVIFSNFSPPPLPDYKSDIAIVKKSKASNSGGGETQWLNIAGVVELHPTLGVHSIAAATLLVMYWPDRSIESAYVEICSRRENE